MEISKVEAKFLSSILRNILEYLDNVDVDGAKVSYTVMQLIEKLEGK